MPIPIAVVMMPRGRIARSRLGIPWRRHQPSRLPRRKQGRVRRLGICLWSRKRGGADGKHESDYYETDHGMSFFYRPATRRARLRSERWGEVGPDLAGGRKPYRPTPTNACARLLPLAHSCAESRHQAERRAAAIGYDCYGVPLALARRSERHLTAHRHVATFADLMSRPSKLDLRQ
jgi:hypothetical protein